MRTKKEKEKFVKECLKEQRITKSELKAIMEQDLKIVQDTENLREEPISAGVVIRRYIKLLSWTNFKTPSVKGAPAQEEPKEPKYHFVKESDLMGIAKKITPQGCSEANKNAQTA